MAPTGNVRKTSEARESFALLPRPNGRFLAPRPLVERTGAWAPDGGETGRATTVMLSAGRAWVHVGRIWGAEWVKYRAMGQESPIESREKGPQAPTRKEIARPRPSVSIAVHGRLRSFRQPTAEAPKVDSGHTAAPRARFHKVANTLSIRPPRASDSTRSIQAIRPPIPFP